MNILHKDKGKTTMLFESADKVTGMSSEEKTRTQRLISGFSTMTMPLRMRR